MLTFSLDKIALKPNSKVLDVGCGEGRHIFGSLHEFSDIHCVGLEQDIPSLHKCNEGLEFFEELNSGSTIFMQGSVYKLPFKNNTFDLVICSEVLEHLEDYRQRARATERLSDRAAEDDHNSSSRCSFETLTSALRSSFPKSESSETLPMVNYNETYY